MIQGQNFTPKTFLDVGTGTGYIPELLIPRFQTSSFYLNDIADQMLDVCKAKFAQAKNVYYLPGDMMALNADTYDCVTSNLALQWMDDLARALHLLHAKSSCIFAFSTLLDGTFHEWESLLAQHQPIERPHYPQAKELASLCTQMKTSDQTLDFWVREIPLTFDHPAAFMMYLKRLGASHSRTVVPLSTLKKLLYSHCQPLTVTYKVFFGRFRKERA